MDDDKRNDGVISDYDLIWGEGFRDFVKKKVGLSDYVKKVLEMEARERENRSRERLERVNCQVHSNKQEQSNCQLRESNNHEQDSVNMGAPPDKSHSNVNSGNILAKSNIVEYSLGFKGQSREFHLRVLESVKKQFDPIGFRR
ncbi:hypothetical protein QIA41_05005 (plasmid) [Borreliella sinica]|uniref:hypothetical protein n=1 Tax=Borreliella sinica TaxID=87162 RepID=UPI003AEF69C1